MPKIILRNSSLYEHTNEVKIGRNADGSCDSRLEDLGQFALQPGKSKEVATVNDTTEVYWKNIYEYHWTHKTAWRFDDETVLNTSGTIASDTPVDICKGEPLVDEKTTRGGVIAQWSVPIGAASSRVQRWGAVQIEFSTNRNEGTDFYLHVEGEVDDDSNRYPVFQGQAHIFADGKSGLGPYVLQDNHVRKIFIQNGQNGVVDVVVKRK